MKTIHFIHNSFSVLDGSANSGSFSFCCLSFEDAAIFESMI